MEENAGQEKALLEQILKKLDDQSVLGDRRHEAQTAFNAEVSQQLQRLQAASPTAASAAKAERMLAKVARECGGDISASQEEILANASFLGGDNALPASSSSDDDDDEEEVFSTPPDATQQQDDPVTMCTLPSTPTPSQPQSSAPPAKKHRFCISKVRGARISTPTPSPDRQQPEQQQLPEQQPQPEQTTHVDPLVRAVLMTPTKTITTSTTGSSCPVLVQDFLALCRKKGIF